MLNENAIYDSLYFQIIMKPGWLSRPRHQSLLPHWIQLWLNQGFHEEEIDDQTYSQEDLECENTLRALEQEDIPKMNDWLKVYLLESKLGKKYTALIYPAFST